MNVSFDFNFWTVFLFVMNFALALWIALSNRGKAASDELKVMKTDLQKSIAQSSEQIGNRLNQHSERLSRIEVDLENAIKDDDLSAIHRRVDPILEKLSKQEGILQSLDKSMQHLTSIIMQKGLS